MYHWLILLSCSLIFSLEAYEPESTLVRSEIDQVAALKGDHSFLIDGVISALSDQACVDRTDLIVKGAQSLFLHRFYVAPHIPTAFGGDTAESAVPARKNCQTDSPF